MKKSMIGRRSIFLLVILVALLASLWFTLYQSSGIPSEVRRAALDWPTANKDYSNSRASLTSLINSSNVSKLGIAWSFPIMGVGEWGAAATNPLILDDTVYLQDLKSNVYAINFRTGAMNWMKKYDMDNIGPLGPAVGNGKIAVTKGHYEIATLDMRGNEIWSQKISDNQNVGIDIQATIYNSTIFTCSVPGVANKNFYTGGSIGTIYALDVNTGKVKWSFDTVDSRDIWGNAKVNSGGGCWYPPAIDLKTGLIYIGTGNPAPWPGTTQFPNGSSRLGLNLYSSSVLALDAKDGHLVWYNQLQSHDIFDYDAQISPILATVLIEGKSQDIVIGSGKMGRVYGMDRVTGKTLWQTNVGKHINDTLTKLPPGITTVAPGPLGGVETVMAYADGTVYVPVVDLPVKYKPTEFVSSSFDLGMGKGRLVAINASNGKILWDKQLDSLNVGAATVVNDLVFTSTFDGKIYAFKRSNGEQVWSIQAPGGINGWPAVKDDTIIFPVGMGPKPVLLAFRLGASTTSLPVPSLPAAGKGKEFQQ